MLDKDFTDYHKRNISEALYIKSIKPIFNIQGGLEKSIPSFQKANQRCCFHLAAIRVINSYCFTVLIHRKMAKVINSGKNSKF